MWERESEAVHLCLLSAKVSMLPITKSFKRNESSQTLETLDPRPYTPTPKPQNLKSCNYILDTDPKVLGSGVLGSSFNNV